MSALNCLLRLTVRVRTGQTVDELQKAVPAIRDSVRAHAARSVVVSPGTVRMEFVLAELLSTSRTTSFPSGAHTSQICMGRREDGTPWMLRSRSGKHSLSAAQAREKAPSSWVSQAVSVQRSNTER